MLRHRLLTVGLAVGTLIAVVLLLGTQLRREFFPEVDAGAFEMYVRAPSGTRIEETEKTIAEVEKFVRKSIGEDLQLIISELGVNSDWSAAYTPNAGPMDAVIKIQLGEERYQVGPGIRPSHPHRRRQGAEVQRPGLRASTPAA